MPRVSSKEYEKFLKEEAQKGKLSLYEQACEYAERILPITPTKNLSNQLKSAIEFSHLNVTPKGTLSLTILVGLILFWISLFFLLIFDLLSPSSIIFTFVVISIAIYFLFNYPVWYATTFRIKASSEMVLAVIYMSISMHLSPNLENAIWFASKNLKGPLAKDLRELLWGIYTRKYESAAQAIDSFIHKWERDNKEFSESLDIIKNSIFESTAKREKMLDEAVSVVLEGTKERMRDYSRKLKSPVTILNALGILLPIVGLVLFPVISIFLPELIKPAMLIVGYDFFLPVFVYFFMNNYLAKRPYSFHQPDLSKHPEFIQEKLIEKPYFIPLIVFVPLVIFGSYQIIKSKELFSLNQLLYSILIILGVTLGIISYCFLSVKRKLKVRKEVVEIESEFIEALFQLSQWVNRGMPLENALKKLNQKIKHLKISKFFEKILYNIEILEMDFERAVFDPKVGAINYYPSTLIEAIMKVIIETSRRGMASASKAMMVVSTYLKDMHRVNEELKSLTEEVTSTMNIQAMLLAPMAAGVTVSLTAIVVQILVSLGETFESTLPQLGAAYGVAGEIGGSILSSLADLNAIIPVDGFQIVVGIYMVEVVSMLAIFLSSIANGEESLIKRLTIAKLLAIGTAVYFASLFITYFMFTAIIPISQLII